MKPVVQLECGHQIKWGEDSDSPGAALPILGGTAFCHECGEDEEILAIAPDPKGATMMWFCYDPAGHGDPVCPDCWKAWATNDKSVYAHTYPYHPNPDKPAVCHGCGAPVPSAVAL